MRSVLVEVQKFHNVESSINNNVVIFDNTYESIGSNYVLSYRNIEKFTMLKNGYSIRWRKERVKTKTTINELGIAEIEIYTEKDNAKHFTKTYDMVTDLGTEYTQKFLEKNVNGAPTYFIISLLKHVPSDFDKEKDIPIKVLSLKHK